MSPNPLLLAVVQLSFTPFVTLGDFAVRLETIGLAALILTALIVTARIARSAAPELDRLRLDDLLLLAICAIPGAVAGGRLGYGLVHADVFSVNPGSLLDPGRGGLELPLAVAGGVVMAVLAGRILDVPVRRWLDAAAVPMLLAIAGGKLVMVLGGSGQGLPFDGQWATAYVGPGPWGSLAPAIPSHPAQLYEALGASLALLVLGVAAAAGAFQARSGAMFAVGAALWLVARAIVEVTWRDPVVLGPLRADQALSLALAAGAIAIAAFDVGRGPRSTAPPGDGAPLSRYSAPLDVVPLIVPGGPTR